ncbi:MAG TPA: rhamnogalacturonan lyase B N-terminal domain-containing protein [Blastocatellia bacterium]|nr:rhamnogalacturonan lyase B N-terminal domain-containing protein [Blastocatellia bacterium]
MKTSSICSTDARSLRQGMLQLGLAVVCLLAPAPAFAAFSATDNGTVITVDSGAGLVYQVNHNGTYLQSIKWNGVELNATTPSHVNSGIAGTVTLRFPSSTVALITVNAGTLIHYFATRANENIIYMATYITAEPSVGELRWITRLKSSIFTGVPAESNNSGTTGAIESSDVFGYSNGTTTSKYYGNQQAKALSIRGVTGSGVGVFMVYGTRETSSGGPFFRDIQNQSSTSGNVELYNYMNSGHNQTEAIRTGLNGPYALVFTNGSTPALPDFSWISSLGLTGYVAASGRGRVIGNGIAGRDTAYTYTVGFANSTAQYWTTAAAGNGQFSCYNMKPGTYTMTIYKGELAVYTESVTVTAGAGTTVNTRTITADPSMTSTIWRIGNWDGTPLEFLNGANISRRHPSDIRNTNWGPTSYTVGSSSASSFPAVQFRLANSPTTVIFSLTSAQVAAHTVKIGITGAYNGGRPVITVNGWTSSNPAASGQPSSRSFTIGTYRGNNTTFTYNVPASAFRAGSNTMTITPISGSSDLGAYLSASWAYDCVELDN